MYAFKLGGRQGNTVTLEVADNLVAVRTRAPGHAADTVGEEASRRVLSQFTPVLDIPEAQIQVLQALAPSDGAAQLRDEARHILKQDPQVRFAGRVLRDTASGAPVLYTENLFVKFKDHVAGGECTQTLAEHGLTVKEHLSYATNAYFASAPENTGTEVFRIANALLDDDRVELAHPEIIREARRRAIAVHQWHLKPTLGIDASVNVEPAWTAATGRGITIAVIDDGVDIDHPEFSLPGKLVAPRDVTLGVDDARPKSDHDSHGTACAGVACAAGQGASGVAPDARLMPIRNVSNLGSQREANAFAWAADHGADVISCSWGPADGEWWNPNDARHQARVPLPDNTRLAIEYALTRGRGGRGCVICWAAGNGNESVDLDGYASYPGVIAVAACNDRNTRSVYSDFGDAVWCAFPSSDFAHPPFGHPAPLTPGIWTTDRSGRLGYNAGALNPFAGTPPGDDHGNYTHTFGGTSSACPGVAGIAALMLQINPELSWRDVKNLIRRSCAKIDPERGDYDGTGHSRLYGYGRPNAALAVELARPSARLQATPLTLSAEARGTLEAEGTEALFEIHLPDRAAVTLAGPPGSDFDLYVRQNEPPTLEHYDARGYTPGPNERITVNPTTPGKHYVLVRSHTGTGAFELRVVLDGAAVA